MFDQTSLELTRNTFAFLLAFAITGWVLSFVLFRQRLGIETRSLLSLALSAPASLLAEITGIATHSITILSFLIGMIILSLLVVVNNRQAILHPRQQLSRYKLERAGAKWYVVPLLLAGVAISWLAVLQQQAIIFNPQGLPGGSPFQWNYLRFVKAVVTNSYVPSTITEWGGTHTFPTEYWVFLVHTAVVAKLAGQIDIVFVERYRFVELCLIVIALYALWSRWMPKWWAFMASILSLAVGFWADRFGSFVPESFGFLLVIWSSWLFDEALERNSYRWGICAGLVSASALLAHAEVWLLTVPVCAGIVAGRLLTHGGSAWVENIRSGFRGIPIDKVVRWDSIRVTLVTGFVLVLLWLGGGVSQGGADRILHLVSMHNNNQQANVRQIGKDPTWALESAMYIPAKINSEPTNIRSRIFGGIFTSKLGPNLSLSQPDTRLALGIGVVLLIIALFGATPRSVRGAITWVVFGICLYAVVLAFFQVYDTYVPLRAALRFSRYNTLIAAGIIASIGWLIYSFITKLLSLLDGETGGLPSLSLAVRSVLVSGSITVALLLLFTPAFEPVSHNVTPNISQDVYEAYQWMGNNLPKNAVVMVNGRTSGSIGAISNQIGWLDGRAPFLESETWRYSATKQLLIARQYFSYPVSRSYLLPERVDYVLAAKNDQNLGGSHFNTAFRSLQHAPNLRLVKSFDNGEVMIFRVVHESRIRSINE